MHALLLCTCISFCVCARNKISLHCDCTSGTIKRRSAGLFLFPNSWFSSFFVHIFLSFHSFQLSNGFPAVTRWHQQLTEATETCRDTQSFLFLISFAPSLQRVVPVEEVALTAAPHRPFCTSLSHACKGLMFLWPAMIHTPWEKSVELRESLV